MCWKPWLGTVYCSNECGVTCRYLLSHSFLVSESVAEILSGSETSFPCDCYHNLVLLLLTLLRDSVPGRIHDALSEGVRLRRGQQGSRLDGCRVSIA
jgi:hypothetical protein